MKSRKGFVSNSSSSSFVLKEVSRDMQIMLIDHINIYNQIYEDNTNYYDTWMLSINGNKLIADTIMDNIDFDGLYNDLKEYKIEDLNISEIARYLNNEIIKKYCTDNKIEYNVIEGSDNLSFCIDNNDRTIMVKPDFDKFFQIKYDDFFKWFKIYSRKNKLDSV